MTTLRFPMICLILSIFFWACQQEVAESKEDIPLSRYQEKHRPQFHFSPDSMWMNDPNGMVYYEGEYHLFYQFYPDSNVWGPMHWGHAVSPDMVRWEHLPIALYPDSLGLIFSGSAVIDHQNTSGLGTDDKGPMVAIFTHHNMEGEKAGRNDFQYQSIAYSNDKGRSWTKYEGNPVIANPGIRDFRDPKVSWHEESQQWVMIFAAYDRAKIYTSPNLIDWIHTSDFGIEGDTRLWECPDLFPMKVAGTDETKWILITSIQKEAPNGGTATSYFVGDFDGKTFRGDPNAQKWIDYGTDNYAMVSWSNVPKEDGRILVLGWMSNWQYATRVPTYRWRSAMTLPRTLTLNKTNGDYEIRSTPVRELESLHQETKPIDAMNFAGNHRLVHEPELGLYKIELTFNKPKEGKVGIKFSNEQRENLLVGYDAAASSYFIDRRQAGQSDFSETFASLHTAPVDYNSDQVQMTLFLDKASIELFADAGRSVMTDIFFPNSPYNKISLFSEGSQATLTSGAITSLKRIW